MKQTKINLFKVTYLIPAKRIVFDLEAITKSVALDENKNGLRITQNLSESICDEILDKLKEKYQFDDAEVYVAITVLLQRGGTNKGAGSTIKFTLRDKSLTAQDLQNTVNAVKKNATNRQFARALANEIAQVAVQLNIEGDLANQMRFEFPDLTQEEAAWCSNFQTTNSQCPEKVRNWLVQNYKNRFRKEQKKKLPKYCMNFIYTKSQRRKIRKDEQRHLRVKESQKKKRKFRKQKQKQKRTKMLSPKKAK